ncbi:MAG: hypothetical protein MRJ66_08990 [Nitrospira sp.]|nr:hypothetical protein [Nitrospira sp.]
MQSEIGPFTLESWAFWAGVVAVGMTAAGALLGCVLVWLALKANALNGEMSSAEEVPPRTLTDTRSNLKRSADWIRQTAVVLTAVGALFGCVSWWVSLAVSDAKEEARMRVESDYASALADLTVAKERAGTLEVEAAGFRERAARAEDLVKVAEAESEEAKRETALVRKNTAKALASMEAANERAAQAEIALMKVKERRAISDQQRTRLHQALKPIQKGPVKIIAVLGDEEAGKFAKEVSSVLKDAGWIDIHVNRGVFSGGIDGFEIRVRDREKVPVFALQMARAFDSIGFDPSLVHDPSVAEGTMEIIIGTDGDSG